MSMAFLYKNIIVPEYKSNVLFVIHMVWACLLLGYALNTDYFIALNDVVLTYITLFIISFGFSYVLVARGHHISFSFGRGLIKSKDVYVLGFLICLISIGLGIIILYHNNYSLKLMRDGILEGSVGSFGLGLSLPLSLCCMYLAKCEKKKWIHALFVCTSLMLAILSTSKIFIILFVIYVTGMNNYISKKKIAIYGCISLLFFGLSSIILGKFSSDPNSNIFNAIFDTLKVYLFSGLSAFNLFVDGKTDLPENILMYPFRGFLGAAMNIPETDILPWVNTGVWETNVYTAFAPWYQSFGYLSSFIFGIGIGVYYGFWFSFRKTIAIGFYQTFLFFPLIMLFFQEHFILSWKMHIIYILCSLILAMTKDAKNE